MSYYSPMIETKAAAKHLAQLLYSTDALNAKVLELTRSHYEKLQGKIKGVLPTLIVVGGNVPEPRAIERVLEEWDDETRYECLRKAGREFKKEHTPFGVVAVLLYAEAWRVQAEGAEYTGGRVSEHPDKQEIIMTAGRTVDGRCAFTKIPVQRLANGTLIFDKQENYLCQEGTTMESDLLKEFFVGWYLEMKEQKAGERK
jgi:hypothetical protein